MKLVEIPDNKIRLVKVEGTHWGFFEVRDKLEQREILYQWSYGMNLDLETV